MDQAKTAADRFMGLGIKTDEERLSYAYMATLSREPSAQEQEIALNFLNSPENQKAPQKAWEGVCHALFSCVDFRYIY